MNKKSKNIEIGGGVFPSLLQVAFIVLKLCKIINWSWWWVLAPTWGTAILTFFIIWITFLVLIRKKQSTNENRRWTND